MISKEAEKEFDKIQCQFMIETVNKQGQKDTLSLIKGILIVKD